MDSNCAKGTLPKATDARYKVQMPFDILSHLLFIRLKG